MTGISSHFILYIDLIHILVYFLYFGMFFIVPTLNKVPKVLTLVYVEYSFTGTTKIRNGHFLVKWGKMGMFWG